MEGTRPYLDLLSAYHVKGQSHTETEDEFFILASSAVRSLKGKRKEKKIVMAQMSKELMI
jgi:hypothetical protein